MGGLEGRSYIDNAHRHSGASVLFGQDVDAFYPSIPRERIGRIFLDVFHFAPEVANLLALLTSRKGELVQGGVASTHLANLALYRTEPELERQMREEGLQYSRFVDDVHVSTRGALSNHARTRVVSAMRACLERHGYRPKRKKQFVASAGEPMHVHGLNVNNSASMPSQRRQQLRNEVFLLERWAQMQPWDAALERTFLRLTARVGQLKRINAGEARRLRHRLNALMPLISASPSVRCACGSEKKDDPRTVHLPDSAADALQELKRSSKVLSSAVFTTPAGVRLTRAQLDARWKRVRKLAGLADFRWHDLRHTRGVVPGAVLGHHSPSVTARYAHMVQGAPVTSHDKVDAKLRGGLPQ